MKHQDRDYDHESGDHGVLYTKQNDFYCQRQNELRSNQCIVTSATNKIKMAFKKL